MTQAASNIFHVIKDPVHGSMQFTTPENNWIKPFIDQENFQRLRHISQLALASWVFPGAVHNRFSHGLGCCYVGSQICSKLELSLEDKQLVILACLLHDIGHGPFSHTFEEIFHKKSLSHEMWTSMFLKDYARDDFLNEFNKRNKDFPLDAEKLKIIETLIRHQPFENQLFSDIVSSQLDADRLDYLLRDSHFCGVTYGEYDFRWLLHCLTIIEQDGRARLGITRKGVGVVEQYLMARRLMMRNVYQNGKKYTAEFLLRSFLEHLAKGIDEDPRFSLLESNALIQFLKQVNLFNQQLDDGASIDHLREQFIEKNYNLYKQLCDYDVFSLVRLLASWENDHPVVSIAKRLQVRHLPKAIPIDAANMDKAKSLADEFKEQYKDKLQSWQVALIQLPHLSYQGSQDPILVKDYAGSVKYLHDDSLMIHAISDKSETSCLVSIDSEIIRKPYMEKFCKDLMRL